MSILLPIIIWMVFGQAFWIYRLRIVSKYWDWKIKSQYFWQDLLEAFVALIYFWILGPFCWVLGPIGE